MNENITGVEIQFTNALAQPESQHAMFLDRACSASVA